MVTSDRWKKLQHIQRREGTDPELGEERGVFSLGLGWVRREKMRTDAKF